MFYEVDADSKSLSVESSVKLECDPDGSGCPVSRWTARLSVPASAQIQDVSSENGEVLDYERTGNTLTVRTETPPTRSELINVGYVIDRNAQQVTENLYTRSISLPGFSGEQTSGTLTVQDFISARSGNGFRYSVDKNTVNFTGTGATNFVTAFGQGDKAEYFEFFGKPVENSSKAYKISVGTLGVTNRFERFPAAVIDAEVYNRTVNEWSAGQYTNATIYLRDSLGDDEKPVLAHETVHGLNDQALGWRSRSSWFDEGTAKYVEFLVRKSSGDYTREVFGEPVSYTRNKDGRRYRYTLPSEGDKDRLWAYYESNSSWMKNWGPKQGNREFGYAYSELVVRNYIQNGGRLSQLYQDIRSESYQTDEEKWRGLSQHIDTTPCKYESRERFESCLDDVNSFDYPVYTVTDIKKTNRSLNVQQLEVEEPEPVRRPESIEVQRASSWLNGFFESLMGFLNSWK
ncbi:hypothetical protein [Candidatus Nanohalococcus occultus]|uniref:hypothetical protein n=1 Tax=Candidatus Nanohalococcus occultus TaxID=2978047 RepID=UPI0039DF74B3